MLESDFSKNHAGNSAAEKSVAGHESSLSLHATATSTRGDAFASSKALRDPLRAWQCVVATKPTKASQKASTRTKPPLNAQIDTCRRCSCRRDDILVRCCRCSCRPHQDQSPNACLRDHTLPTGESRKQKRGNTAQRNSGFQKSRERPATSSSTGAKNFEAHCRLHSTRLPHTRTRATSRLHLPTPTHQGAQQQPSNSTGQKGG